MRRASHLLPGHQAERSHCATQTRLNGPRGGGDGRHPPPPVTTIQGLQQRSRSHSEQPGPRDHDKVCHHPGGRTHRAGQVVSKIWPPGGSRGEQLAKVQSKTTLRPRAAAPVNRSRSLVQVQALSQFSGRTEEQGRGGPLVYGCCCTIANRHRDDPSPFQRDIGLCVGDPMWGGGTTKGVEVARQGQLDTDVTDTVNSDSATTLEGPTVLGFLGTGAQGVRDTGPVPRICQSVLSWESLECSIPRARCRA